MKIKTKVALGLGVIFVLLSVVFGFTYMKLTEVKFYRAEALLSQRELQLTTSIRANVRNLFLETYENIFVSNARVPVNISSETRKEIESQFAEYQSHYQNDQIQNEIMNRVYQDYQLILTNLEMIYQEARGGSLSKAKSSLLQVRENLFNRQFISNIEALISSQIAESKLDDLQLEKSLVELNQIFLLSIVFFGLIIVYAFVFSDSLGRRLKKLEVAVENMSAGNFNSVFAKDPGEDEISVLSNAFRSMSQKLVQQQQSLLVTSKMSALGEMAGGIAHEINTPLSVILLWSDQLKEQIASQTPDRQLIRSSIDAIQATVERISKIIRGLRSFARDGQNDPLLEANIRDIIEDTLSLCQERFKRNGIDVRVQLSLGGEAQLICRVTQISQVLLNLLNNSYDAIQNLPVKWISIEVQSEGQWIVLSVTDSGPGIDQAIRDRLMDPFFTTKDVGKGTGLGLSISKGIIESHKGEFFLDTDSENTRFVMKLPRA